MTAVRLFTPAEAGAILRVSADVVRRRVNSGELRGVDVGTEKYPRMRIREDDLAEYIDRLKSVLAAN